MTREWQVAINDFAFAAYETFLLPGKLVLNHLPARAQALLQNPGASAQANPDLPSALVSLLFWLLLVWFLWKSFRRVAELAWYLRIAARIFAFRIARGLHNFFASLLRNFRRIMPHRRSIAGSQLGEVNFDNLDLAVLKTSARLGPGLATSAPDLAVELARRPAQVQQSLDKLRKYHMLVVVIGSSDGFDHYRVSPSGSAFLASWLRQESRA